MKAEDLYLVKVGGNVLENESDRILFLEQFSKIPGLKILVHGGGKMATDLATRLGIHTTMIEGRRVTDTPMLQVAVMTYAGLVNKQIVSQLQSMGNNAIGLTGADANLIRSDKRPIQAGLDYGWVGDPVEVNTRFLQTMLTAALIPVFAPLTHDANGNMLNTNADTIAKHLAIAMSPFYAVKLIYCFEQPGVMLDLQDSKSLVKNLSQSDFEVLKQSGKIHSGMIPKLQNAFEAVKAGVEEVHVMHFDQIGKLVTSEYYDCTVIR